MTITAFHFKEVQSERSSDSNSQIKEIFLREGLLIEQSEWQGYHPGPGGGPLPASKYFFTEELNRELAIFLKNLAFAERPSPSPSEPGLSAGPPPPMRGQAAPSPYLQGRESHSYTLSVHWTEDGIAHSHEFTAPGRPQAFRDADRARLYKKFQDLQGFLTQLIQRAEHKVESFEEREADLFYRRFHYRPGQVPETVSELYYYATFEDVLKRYDWDRGKTPFVFQAMGGLDFFVVQRPNAGPELRTEYEGKPEFFEALAKLLVRFGLDKTPGALYADNAGLPFGEKRVTHHFRVMFNNNSYWRHDYQYTHYCSPEILAHYAAQDSPVNGFSQLRAELEALLQSDLVRVKEK